MLDFESNAIDSDALMGIGNTCGRAADIALSDCRSGASLAHGLLLVRPHAAA